MVSQSFNFFKGNALVAAENFCNRGNLHKGYIDEIRNFLRQNSQPQKTGKPMPKPQNQTQKTNNSSSSSKGKSLAPVFQGNFKFPKVLFSFIQNFTIRFLT